MSISSEAFYDHLVDSGIVLDPDGVHHELAGGLHGKKADFDNIPRDSELYREWVAVNVAYIERTYAEPPTVIIGVANGTNRLAADVAAYFPGESFGLVSEKPDDRRMPLLLSPKAEKFLSLWRPEEALILEDVAKSGTNVAMIARAVRESGVIPKVLTTWQRFPVLQRLDDMHVPYNAIIEKPLEAYPPDLCREIGHCAMDWDLIPRE